MLTFLMVLDALVAILLIAAVLGRRRYRVQREGARYGCALGACDGRPGGAFRCDYARDCQDDDVGRP